MSSDEWDLWQRMNPTAITDREFAATPCADCTVRFAREMRRIGKCNGTPGLIE